MAGQAGLIRASDVGRYTTAPPYGSPSPLEHFARFVDEHAEVLFRWHPDLVWC